MELKFGKFSYCLRFSVSPYYGQGIFFERRIPQHVDIREFIKDYIIPQINVAPYVEVHPIPFHNEDTVTIEYYLLCREKPGCWYTVRIPEQLFETTQEHLPLYGLQSCSVLDKLSEIFQRISPSHELGNLYEKIHITRK